MINEEGFILETQWWFNILGLKCKKNQELIISWDNVKFSDNIQHHFMIKFLEWLRIQGTCLNIKMSLYIKPIDNSILTGEKFKLIPVIPKLDKVVHSLYNYLFNILCKCLARAIKLKERKVIWIRNEGVKLSFFADDLIVCIRE